MGTWPILGALGDEDRRRLLATARRRRFDRRQALFHEGDQADAVHLIDSGRVAVRLTIPLGAVATVSVLGPGEAVGELALLGSSSRRTATAVALEATQTLAIHQTSFDQLRREHPAVSDALLEMLADTIRRTTAQLVEALFVPIDERVAGCLCHLADRASGPDRRLIPLTQEELAGMVGATRPTVNQILKKAEAAGAVRTGRGLVEILDQTRLRQLAGQRPG